MFLSIVPAYRLDQPKSHFLHKRAEVSQTLEPQTHRTVLHGCTDLRAIAFPTRHIGGSRPRCHERLPIKIDKTQELKGARS
jgi:hypothetical protein